MCDHDYDMSSLQSVATVSYARWTPSQIVEDLMLNAELDGVNSMIIKADANWLYTDLTVLDILNKFNDLGEHLLSRWSKLRIYLVGLLDDVSVFDTSSVVVDYFRDLTKRFRD